MKLKATKFHSAIFVIILLFQLYVDSFKINITVQFFVLTIFFIFEKQTISKSFLKVITPIFYIFLICFIGTFFHQYHSYNIIKDISHFIKPLLCLLIGYCYFKKINNIKTFIQTIVITGFISSIFHYFFIASIQRIATVSDIRQYGTDNFVELFAVLFLIFYKRFYKDRLFKSKFKSTIILISVLLSSILYFSRTMIVMAVIVILTIYGYTIITKRSAKIGIALVAFILLFYAFLFSIHIQRNKTGIESFLFKVKNAPAEVFKTHINRENHADLWDHWRGYEAERAIVLLKGDPSGFIFGLGYGSLVNLKFYAPLSDDKKGMKYISELHNGYIYVLYKSGFIGLILYLFFLFQLYIKIDFNRDFVKVFISAIGLSVFITTLVIGSIFNGNPTILFLLGGLLFFDDQSKKPKFAND